VSERLRIQRAGRISRAVCSAESRLSKVRGVLSSLLESSRRFEETRGESRRSVGGAQRSSERDPRAAGLQAPQRAAKAHPPLRPRAPAGPPPRPAPSQPPLPLPPCRAPRPWRSKCLSAGRPSRLAPSPPPPPYCSLYVHPSVASTPLALSPPHARLQPHRPACPRCSRPRASTAPRTGLGRSTPEAGRTPPEAGPPRATRLTPRGGSCARRRARRGAPASQPAAPAVFPPLFARAVRTRALRLHRSPSAPRGGPDWALTDELTPLPWRTRRA
jgi:hypothetical protein